MCYRVTVGMYLDVSFFSRREDLNEIYIHIFSIWIEITVCVREGEGEGEREREKKRVKKNERDWGGIE